MICLRQTSKKNVGSEYPRHARRIASTLLDRGVAAMVQCKRVQ